MKYYNRRTDAIMMPSTFRWKYSDAIHSERDRDIMKYAPLVMKVVNKFNRDDARVGVFDKHDLIQTGFVGLIEGYDRIIKSEGIVNVNYLEINIKGTIDRYLNYQGTGVAIPEYQLQKAKAEIVADRIFGAWMYSFRIDDINSKVDKEFTAALRQHETLKEEESWDNVELNDELSNIMWQLTNRERDVINMSYGINLPKMSMKEIAEHFDLSMSGIEKVKRNAIKKLNTESNRIFFEKYL